MLRDKLCIVTTDSPTLEERRFVVPRHNNLDHTYLCEVFSNFKSLCSKQPEKNWEKIKEMNLQVIFADWEMSFNEIVRSLTKPDKKP